MTKAEAEAKAKAEAEKADAPARSEEVARVTAAKAQAEEKARVEAEARAKMPCEYCGMVQEHALGCPAVTKVVCVKMGCPGCSFKGSCKHIK